MHSELPVIRFHLTNRLRTIIIKEKIAVGVRAYDWNGQKWLQYFFHSDRTRTRAAAAMRSGKGFMEINVKHVDTEVARSSDSHHRIQIRSVHVDESAVRVK
jgi:hypothetical protein